MTNRPNSPRLKAIMDSPDFDEQIETMSVVELEEFIRYLNIYGDDCQIRDCLRERDFRLRDQWRCSDVDLEHLKRVNTLVMEKFQQTIKEAENLFEHLKKVEMPTFYRFNITASVYPKRPEKLNIEFADDGSSSDYLAMAQELSHQAEKEHCRYCFEMDMSYDYDDKSECINYGTDFDDNNELQDWSYETFLEIGIKNRERFFLSHAMHSLLTHCEYAPQDVIRIEAFESKIIVEYEDLQK